MKELVLKPSTNTHVLHSNKIKVIQETEHFKLVEVDPESAVVKHGKGTPNEEDKPHGSIGIEKKYVIFFTQQEVNPITKKLQDTFD